MNYKYMVCTRCYTFNHAPYIVDAMDGFAIQETTFPVITLIVDDASTDGEQNVIRHYLAEHFQEPYRKEETDDFQLICANHNTNPNCTFVVILLNYNHYSVKKPKITYFSEWYDNSKYHAFCEGDDYWIDEHKIQIQVSFLEKHNRISLCFHPAKILGDDFQVSIPEKIGHSSINDLCFGNYIATGSVLCRNDGRIEYFRQKRIRRSRVGDYQTFMSYALIGGLYSFNRIMSVYRVHKDNSWRGSDLLEKRLDYNGYLYNLIHIDEMPQFPKLILRIRLAINSISLKYEGTGETRETAKMFHCLQNWKYTVSTYANKVKRFLLSRLLNILEIIEFIFYKLNNCFK